MLPPGHDRKGNEPILVSRGFARSGSATVGRAPPEAFAPQLENGCEDAILSSRTVLPFGRMRDAMKAAWLLAVIACGTVLCLPGFICPARAEPVQLTVRPSDTDPAIRAADTPHLVLYDSNTKSGRLLLFMPGTDAVPTRGPMKFLRTAVAQGYHVISLSYIDVPAVAQVCQRLRDPTCAERFREKRVFGDDVTSVIEDAPADAIMNRFIKLLLYLVAHDPAGNWGQFMDKGTPAWSRIVLAGQSQGGGMAAFIAKRVVVARVLMFSGGWDTDRQGQIASWYSQPSATPSARWYATYNVAEAAAARLAVIYRALNIPQANIFALSLPPMRPERTHGDGILNPAYGPQWIGMLGNGSS